MKSPAYSGSIPANLALLSLTLLLLNVGCASPGTPRPPSLQLPAIITDFSAERVGDHVQLRWTTPAKTTDNLNLRGPATAELCRVTLPRAQAPAQPAPVCAPLRRVAVQPGASDITDPLPPALLADPQRLLLYRVTLLNNHGRSAGTSAPAFAVAGAAPPAVTNLHGQATAKGALLQWQPADNADAIELLRLHPVAASSARPAGGQTLLSAPKEPPELHLRAGGPTSETAPFRPDAGGTLDTTAHRGEIYLYTAQRVRKVLLQGQTLELRSAPAAVTIAMRDTFPPAAPTGLEAVATGQPPSIDLSWTPNTEPDLAGYLVYRQELTPSGAVGSLVRLTPDPISAPGFQDAGALPGHAYAYTVTARDAEGNESAPSPAAREELRLPGAGGIVFP